MRHAAFEFLGLGGIAATQAGFATPRQAAAWGRGRSYLPVMHGPQSPTSAGNDILTAVGNRYIIKTKLCPVHEAWAEPVVGRSRRGAETVAPGSRADLRMRESGLQRYLPIAPAGPGMVALAQP